MKRTLITAFLLAASWIAATAQDFPEKDEQGGVIYYKIFSADPENEGLCLQDNTRDTSSRYPFLLMPHEQDNKLQEWQFMPGTAEGTYLLRNRSTYRFVSVGGNWVDAFYVVDFATKKSTENAILFTPLKNGQMTMTYKSGSTTHYILAGDNSKGPEIFSKDKHYNSNRAWYVYPASTVPSEVAEMRQGEVIIQAVGRRVVVCGATHWHLYDIQGRELPHDGEQQPGIYVVEADGAMKNVLVR